MSDILKAIAIAAGTAIVTKLIDMYFEELKEANKQQPSQKEVKSNGC